MAGHQDIGEGGRSRTRAMVVIALFAMPALALALRRQDGLRDLAFVYLAIAHVLRTIGKVV